MTHHRYRLLQIAIVLGLALYLLERLSSGKLYWYINARFAALTLLGILGLFALGGNALKTLRWRALPGEAENGHDHHEHSHSPANLIWLALPLVVGLLIPARPLGADAAANKGVTVAGPMVAGGSLPSHLALAPDERNVLDWIRLFNYESDLSAHLGQEANVIGFVYLDERLPEQHFLVARFTVSCCVADAFAIGMAVQWPETLPANQWVNVRGPVQALEVEGQRVPLILAETVVPVNPPEQPYLFP